MNKLAIGTVQFGMSYGVANSTGQTSIEEAESILSLAHEHGVQTIDTAIAYGTSEEVLGKVGVDKFQVITKLPPVPTDSMTKEWCEKELAGSLGKLKLNKVYSVLLHQPRQLLEENGALLYKVMQDLKAKGLVDKIGISVYEPRDLNELCEKYDFDLVQLPYNIIDARWTGWLEKLFLDKVEVHVRSVFLQGLLLMSQQDRPTIFNKWDKQWSIWGDWLKLHNLTPLEACIGYALSRPEISKVIVGIDSKEQLEQIMKISNINLPELPANLQMTDQQLLNPANWNKL